MSLAYTRGCLDRVAGIPIEKNPFDRQEEFADYRDWNNGWLDAEIEEDDDENQ